MNLQKMKRKSEKTERNSKRRITVSALLLVLSAGLMVLSVQAPDLAEWYSQNIYPVLVSAIGRLTGLLPFSLAEICLYLLLAALVSVADLSVYRNRAERGGRAPALRLVFLRGTCGLDPCISIYGRMRRQLSQEDIFVRRGDHSF